MRVVELKKYDVVDCLLDVDEYLKDFRWVIVDGKPCIVDKKYNRLFMVQCFEIQSKVYLRMRYMGEYINSWLQSVEKNLSEYLQ